LSGPVGGRGRGGDEHRREARGDGQSCGHGARNASARAR
jgi:hypothetical protein